MITLPVTSASLPSNLECILTNANWQLLVSLLSVTSPNALQIVIADTEPGPDEREYLWFRLDSDGRPDRLYYYTEGKWMAKHPDFEGKVIMWEGDAADVPTLDGGTAGAVTLTSGPFWEVIEEMEGRIPVGPGELEPSGTVLAVGDEAGADEVELEAEQLPTAADIFGVNNVVGPFLDVTAGGSFEVETDTGTTHRVGNWNGIGDPHPNLPPVRAIYFLRKTARLFYTAP